jgi:hypothetical protein
VSSFGETKSLFWASKNSENAYMCKHMSSTYYWICVDSFRMWPAQKIVGRINEFFFHPFRVTLCSQQHNVLSRKTLRTFRYHVYESTHSENIGFFWKLLNTKLHSNWIIYYLISCVNNIYLFYNGSDKI